MSCSTILPNTSDSLFKLLDNTLLSDEHIEMKYRLMKETSLKELCRVLANRGTPSDRYPARSEDAVSDGEKAA